MQTLHLKANAKINLSLDVIGKKANGYHLLEMVMQEIDLHDDVIITKTDTGLIRLKTNLKDLPVDENNLAFRAAQLMKKTYQIKAGYDIELIKRIPVAAGLAGGSADCAAVLKGVNHLEQIAASDDTLSVLSQELGSDIAFCLQGNTALAEGTGTTLTALLAPSDYIVIIVKPDFEVSTKIIYQTLNWRAVAKRPNTKALIRNLQEGSLVHAVKNMYNVLEDVVASDYKEIKFIKNKLISTGAMYAQMSGSGPAVFGIYNDYNRAHLACDILLKYYSQTHLAKPIVKII